MVEVLPIPTILEGTVLYLSNQRPVIDGVEPVSQDPDWAPPKTSAALGLLDPGPSVSNAAVQKVLDVLRPLIGMGCSGSGTRFHTWYNSTIENIGAWCYAWCAITQSYATTFGGANNIFKDRAYVPFIVQDAQQRVLDAEWHQGAAGMRPGDMVIYDWERYFNNIWGADHIGICEFDLSGGQWTMLEGNAGSGQLVRVKRDSKYIYGYVRLNWAKADGVVPSTSVPKPAPAPSAGTPTGLKAPAFPLRATQYFGPESGPANSISGYWNNGKRDKAGHPGLKAWQQRMIDRRWNLGPDGADGLFGPRTAEVARAFQTEKGLEIDGKIGPETWRAAWEAPVS